MFDNDTTLDDPKVSERFNASDSDITAISSDGILFKVHRRNLEMHSEGFISQRDENVITAAEKASVLELLFQYMYRQPQPNLAMVPFFDLALLAEAVEKYHVFSAQEVCKAHMRANISAEPIIVLSYATRYGYHDLCDEAAPRTVGMTNEIALKVLGTRSFARWALYKDGWMKALRDAQSRTGRVLHKGGREACEEWWPFQAKILSALGCDPENLQEVTGIFRRHVKMLKECSHCRTRAEQWQTSMEAAVLRIPTFTEAQALLTIGNAP
ncbi:uncharacterized protein LAESUDRAFT_681702 [Laetiporus sulphureus 93-53]|uniref:BTB domain-containing protein n=1 Tax=Laetiporus sulphureus 93-53 TaxID=1314785 RepID=A0A165DP17_9APHY|nr:uncharacterized protein LAESUDRAFT_681702 [Laetiporus sulphureus 93-53]KZT05307.1 hypothetical protein LAESUDRAFT_681702 [Laetiporus sulphureus 93-53]